jgi:hypothetical protein
VIAVQADAADAALAVDPALAKRGGGPDLVGHVAVY